MCVCVCVCVARPIFSFAFLKAFNFEKDIIDDSPNKIDQTKVI